MARKFRIETDKRNIPSVYKLPIVQFKWTQDLPFNDGTNLDIGDFNSHSTSWGCGNINKDGELVKE